MHKEHAGRESPDVVRAGPEVQDLAAASIQKTRRRGDAGTRRRGKNEYAADDGRRAVHHSALIVHRFQNARAEANEDAAIEGIVRWVHVACNERTIIVVVARPFRSPRRESEHGFSIGLKRPRHAPMTVPFIRYFEVHEEGFVLRAVVADAGPRPYCLAGIDSVRRARETDEGDVAVVDTGGIRNVVVILEFVSVERRGARYVDGSLSGRGPGEELDGRGIAGGEIRYARATILSSTRTNSGNRWRTRESAIDTLKPWAGCATRPGTR